MMSLLSLTAWGRRRETKRESLTEYFRRGGPGACQTIHPESVASNPLPSNVPSPDLLPADRGWWGYSFRDVPARVSGETQIATIPDCRVLWYRDPAKANDFFPAVVTGAGTALDMREIRFRPGHAEALRAAPPARRVRRATWIIERVYHNHSHWLTAHLPKLLLLRDLGRLDGVLLPRERTSAMDGSLRLLGFEPNDFATFGEDRFLEVDELTVLATDRFRPELLRTVPEACALSSAPRGSRRVFISRSQAARRRLLNEEALWPLLDAAGFERVHLETMPFEEQVSLMRQAAVLIAPHGAGLTNMLFVPPAADVIEMADLGFPNPNFYALAAALGHRYWLIPAQPHGDRHPLERDLTVEPDALRRTLERFAQ
jgi:hypothetical protein